MECDLSLQARAERRLLSGALRARRSGNSQAEAGNGRYDYYFAAEAPDDLLLVETWTTPELQQAHCQTETFARLQALKAQFCDGVEIEKFTWKSAADADN